MNVAALQVARHVALKELLLKKAEMEAERSRCNDMKSAAWTF